VRVMDPSRARQMWHLLEPIHASVYFAPEAKPTYTEAGLKGYWMGYFASRSAAFGEASAEIVMATFYNFAEHLVRRAIPDAWRLSTPQRVLDARMSVADQVLTRVFEDAPEVAEAAEIAEDIARRARPEGRALFAAHASLAWPSEPRLRLWHAATLLREHRGDGHIAVLVSRDIDGLQSHILAAAAGAVDPMTQKQNRGFTDDQWDAAATQLRERGLLDDTGAFTPQGRTLKQDIEAVTDQLALAPYVDAGEDACAGLERSITALAAKTEIPAKNPMGLTRA
jgi:hypothetical protein